MSDTIDTATARKLVEARAIRGVSIIGQPDGWSVMLKVGKQEKPLGTQRTDKPRTWVSLDTCVAYLRSELHLTRFDLLDARNHARKTIRRRQDSAERMKRAHEAAAYDAWFRDQVQTAIDDPRPSIPDDEARARFAARKAALRQGTTR